MIRRRPKRSLTLCGLETLESRGLMSALAFAHGAQSFVYTETDNSNLNQNAVIAYRQNAQGQLTEIGSFQTDGTGVANPTGLLGPDDSDKEVIASPDGRFVFAVNQGSNSVAEFRVNLNGSLDLVGRSAVNSGGTQPISLSIANDRLYVVNRGNEVQGETATVAPTITVFNILPNGWLARDGAATTELPLGLSPSQLLISSKSQEAFLGTFTPTPLNNVAEANEVVPFHIAANGSLVPLASGGVGAPVNPPLLLGLSQHPTENIVYAGLTGVNEVGVFSVDGAGNLKLADTVAVQGSAPCWTLVSANGKFLYTIDTGSNSVGVFSLANPLHPVQIQEFTLGGPQNSTGNPTAARQTTDFEFSLNPSGNTLYVIDHSTDATGTFPQGNALHVLSVAADGKLSERASSPVFLPSNIPVGADPQGVAVIAANGFGGIR
jgi:6-phosphogluconolactonase (cycloisomerase 2 family)